MVFATPIMQLILPSKYYISWQLFFLIANFMNFLVKDIVFRVIFASVFFQYVKIEK